MSRLTYIKNYNNLSGGVITDANKLSVAPENTVKDALNFEFSATEGASRRKSLDLESGISGSDYVQLNSDLAIGATKQQVFSFKSVLDVLDTPTHDIVFNTFESKGITYDLGSDPQLADAVADSSVNINSAVSGKLWNSIAWSPKLGLFVAAGFDGSSSAEPMMVSSDGEYWSPATSYSIASPVTGYSINCITWSPSLEIFIAITGFYTFISSDGFHWDVHAGSSVSWEASAWSPELDILVGLGSFAGGFAQSSTDGITWTSRTIDNKTWMAVTWSPELGLFAAVARTGTGQRVTTSPDGITWTLRATPATDRDWYGITWSPELGKFVAVGNSDYVMTSSNGTTWTETSGSGEANQWNSVAWSPSLSLFVAVSQDGTNRVMTSPNGTTWTSRLVDAEYWQAVTWSPELGKFVAGESWGTMFSVDGINWNTEPVQGLKDWIALQGIPVGAVGTPELSILHNTDATTYELTTTLGLGSGALIRDFTGVRDTVTVDSNPDVMAIVAGSITGTFQEEDITITNGTITRRLRIVDLRTASSWGVDKSLITSADTEFDGADTTNYTTYTVIGETSGATATITSVANVGLSDAHRYNLINQGWTQAHMDTYAKSRDVWPSNAQTWYSGRDSSNNFSPTELDKIAFGNSEAPRGSILLNPFREWRYSRVPGVWVGSIANSTYSRGFTTIAKFGSRVALSGASINGVENGVYISPILINKVATQDSASVRDLDFSEVFKFYQRNDPTADLQNELLPDDGLFIPVTAANRIYKLVELENAILVIADNGVWAITGLDLQSGFQTDAFSVYKVTGATGTTNVRSIVATSESVYYWAADGIYAITVGSKGEFTAANITINRISGLYKEITTAVREAAIGYYDEYNHNVYWAYNGEAVAAYPEFRNKMLVLNLAINAYYPLQVPIKLTDANGDLSTFYMSINGFTQDPAYPNPDGTIPLKLFVTETDGTTWKHSVMEFTNANTVFDDYSQWRTDVHSDNHAGVDEAAFIETHPDTLGDTSRDKQAVWIFTHMTKTETGWTDLGGGALAPIGESGLLMRTQWDWHDSSAGGKWGNQRNIYRHKRPYVPVDDTDLYDTGESVISTKNKAYGRGVALGVRFDAQAGLDAVLLGFAIPYSIAGSP